MRNTLVGPLLLAIAMVCVAQDVKKKEAKPRPDLTGTWVLDKSKTRPVSKFDSTLVISHRDPELRILRKDVRKREYVEKEYLFYTDGRGEANPMYYGGGKFDSNTRWEGNKVVAYTCNRRYPQQKCRGAPWEWKLSADGQKLTYTTSYVMSFDYGSAGGIYVPPAFESGEDKLVYRRAP